MGLAQKFLPQASPQPCVGAFAAGSTRLRGPVQRADGGRIDPCRFESMMDALLAAKIAFCRLNLWCPKRNWICSNLPPEAGRTEHRSEPDREARVCGATM